MIKVISLVIDPPALKERGVNKINVLEVEVKCNFLYQKLIRFFIFEGNRS